MRRLPVVLAGAMSLAFAACSAPAAPASAPQSGAPTEVQPKPGGILHVAVANDFYDFDPTYNGSGTPNNYGAMLSYDTLIGFKTGPDVPYGDMTLAPKLAEKWEVSPDAKSFTFTLRKGLKWANLPPVNGRDLTSADIKFSYEYESREGEFKDSKLPKGPYSFTFEGLDRIDTPDPLTVVVRFKQPFVPFIAYLPTYANTILPREIYTADGHFKDRVAGSGPFQFDKAASQSGTRWVFKKNTTYWQPGKPYLDEVQYFVLKGDATLRAAFVAKQIDALDVDTPNYNEAKPNLGSANAKKWISPQPFALWMSQRYPPMEKEGVRKAISLAVNQDEFDKITSGGLGGWSLPGVSSDFFTQDEIKKVVKFDPEQAKKLLADAGYPNGLDLKLTSSVARNTGSPSAQEQLLQAQLKKIGVNATLETPDSATWRTRLYSGDFNLMLLNEKRFGDPDSLFYAQHLSSSSGNFEYIKDPKLDQLIQAQRAESDTAKRNDLIGQTSRYLYEKSYHTAVYREVMYTLSQAYVRNYNSHWLTEGMDAQNIWLDK